MNIVYGEYYYNQITTVTNVQTENILYIINAII